MKRLNQELSINTRIKVIILGFLTSVGLLISNKLTGDQWVTFNVFIFGFFIGSKASDSFAMRGQNANSNL